MYVDYKNRNLYSTTYKRNKNEEKCFSNYHISNIENGYSVLGIETFAKICNALNTHLTISY